MVDDGVRVSEVRVGFVLLPVHLLGIHNYLRSLMGAVAMLPGKPIVPVIFCGNNRKDVSADFPGIEMVWTSLLDRKSAAWWARKILMKLTGEDVLLRRLLQKHGVTVLSHSLHLGRQSLVKTIGWIPDFQHVHLPRFFSNEERAAERAGFLDLCARCDRVVVSSENALEDLRSFSPEHAHKGELLRFVASPIAPGDVACLEEMQRLYGFAGKYFLLPNQFWAHKNHRLVIEALAVLKERGERVLVLATGSLKDHRHPEFFDSLMRLVHECDVLDCFRVLGVIPFEHLACLMRHAVAFINPSRFEGWSTSVEEAKSMGKLILLSDIAVHREQNPARGIFFSPEDEEGLADAMVAAREAFDAAEDEALQLAARSEYPVRLREFGEAYLRIVLKTVEGK
ncbi:MAG: glycosyltransferase family 1 protein [Acidobacteriota bacterium]